MPLRPQPVVEFAQRPPPGPVKEALETLAKVLGKVTALVDVALLLEAAGYTATNAAGGAGTALTFSRTPVDFADAGCDQVRVVVRGKNSVAGSVTVTVHDVTQNLELCRVVVTGSTEQTAIGLWTTIKPTGLDQEVEVRVIGNGADDPVFLRVSLQGRTLQARR